MARRHHATVAGIALALGLICLAWGRFQGPGAWLVRGYAGDVVIVIFLVAVLGLVTSLRVGPRIALVVALAAGLELFQLWHHQRGITGVALGTTFDPYDLGAYGLGALIAWAVESKLHCVAAPA